MPDTDPPTDDIGPVSGPVNGPVNGPVSGPAAGAADAHPLGTVRIGTAQFSIEQLSPAVLAGLDCPPSATLQTLPDVLVDQLLAELPGWQRRAARIEQRFAFRNWLETLGFVSAVGWLAHREDHHPELAVSYRHCEVGFTTHSAGGLSVNDLICAAKVSALLGRDAT